MTDTVIFKNNSSSRVKIDTPAASITITVETGTGALFPSPGADEFFPLIIQDRRTGQFEIAYCTQRVNDILTVDRAQEGTIAQDWLMGASCWSTATAGTWQTYFAYAWSKDQADARYLALSGGIMTGGLELSADPITDAQAATKKYVDDVAAGITSLTEAPIDGNPYVRKDAGWVVGVTKVDSDAFQAYVGGVFVVFDDRLTADEGNIAANTAAIALRLTDAPSDGTEYLRKDGAWAHPASAIPEAPVDGTAYRRKNAAWEQQTAASMLVDIKTVDGPGSGLDADLLGSVASASYALLASPVFSGVPTVPTAAPGTNTLQVASTAFVTTADNLKAPLASPGLTGTPTAPTASAANSTTQIATTAQVQSAIAAKAVRFDAVQGLSGGQQTQAQQNMGVEVGVSVEQNGPGKVDFFLRKTPPTGWLKANGAAVSRATYATLYAALCPAFSITSMPTASPGVVNATAHGLAVGEPVAFFTTAVVPTGLVAGTVYYVIAAGFGANAFQVSATQGGAAINFATPGSGTLTGRYHPTGAGDGSTTFNVPDFRGYFLRAAADGGSVDSGRLIDNLPQASANLAHAHAGSTVASISALTGGAASGLQRTAAGTSLVAFALTISSDGGAEARPVNYALLACIKY